MITSISVHPSLSRGWAAGIAYTGYQSGYADVYVIDLASGARNRIVNFPGTNSGAAFSPDGNRIALTISKDGNPELYTVSAQRRRGRADHPDPRRRVGPDVVARWLRNHLLVRRRGRAAALSDLRRAAEAASRSRPATATARSRAGRRTGKRSRSTFAPAANSRSS